MHDPFAILLLGDTVFAAIQPFKGSLDGNRNVAGRLGRKLVALFPGDIDGEGEWRRCGHGLKLDN
jgi:hypothetical protein